MFASVPAATPILHSNHHTPSIISLAVQTLTSNIDQFSREDLNELPADILSLLLTQLSRNAALTLPLLYKLNPLCDEVEELFFGSCTFLTSPILTQFVNNWKNLSILRLDKCYHLYDVDALLNCPSLANITILSFNSCRRIQSQSLNQLLQHTVNLTSLDVSGTRCDTTTLITIATKRLKLRYLDIGGCFITTGLKALAEAETPIEHLNIDNCFNFTTAELQCLHTFPLHYLHVQFLSKMSNEILLSLSNITTLTEVDCSRNAALSDESTEAFLQSKERLHTLCLARTEIGDSGCSVLSELTQLTMLDLGFNSDISDQGVILLSQTLTSLNTLILSYCTITDDFVINHLRHFKLLEHLKINGCRSITEQGIQHLFGNQHEETTADTNGNILPTFGSSLLTIDFGSPTLTNHLLGSLNLNAFPFLNKIGIWSSSMSDSSFYSFIELQSNWQLDESMKSRNSGTYVLTKKKEVKPVLPALEHSY